MASRSMSPVRGAASAPRTLGVTVKYMLLIYTNAANWAALSEADRHALNADYGTFTQEIVASGEFVSGEPLAGVESATTVKVRGGGTDTTDGPFIESKEHLAGYYVV